MLSQGTWKQPALKGNNFLLYTALQHVLLEECKGILWLTTYVNLQITKCRICWICLNTTYSSSVSLAFCILLFYPCFHVWWMNSHWLYVRAENQLKTSKFNEKDWNEVLVFHEIIVYVLSVCANGDRKIQLSVNPAMCVLEDFSIVYKLCYNVFSCLI